MNEFRADLHCHSSFSDGTDSPEQLIQLAAEKGLSALSITDHDTTAAYPKAFEYAKNFSILLISGIELSASIRSHSVHILGYAFDLKSPELASLCARHKTRRENRNKAMLDKLRAVGIELDPDALVLHNGSYGRPHIAQALMEKGVVSSIQEAFEKYLAEGKLAYVPGEMISAEETIEVIHQAKGKAILAHPHLIKRSTLVREMLNMPFDGLEGYYARFAAHQEKKWIDIAKQRGWLITGGSDYHGSIKPQSMLGSSWVDKETFNALYHHFIQVNQF